MEGEGSSQGEGPRRKWTSDVRTSDVEVGPSQVPTGAGREKVGQASAHPDSVLLFKDNYYNLAEHWPAPASGLSMLYTPYD